MITRAQYIKRQRMKQYIKLGLVFATGVVIFFAIIFGLIGLFSSSDDEELANNQSSNVVIEKPHITERFLTQSEYARPGTKLENVSAIVVHSAPDENSSASDNWNYYESLKDQAVNANNASKSNDESNQEIPEKRESVHFLIDLSGEIIELIPLDEISLSAKGRNYDTISIEYCYPKMDQSPTQETLDSLTGLISYLCDTYHIEKTNILRHSDLTSSSCPVHYSKNSNDWQTLLERIVIK